MKLSALGLALISITLVLAAILVSIDSLHAMFALLTWALLAFYLAAIAQTESLSQPAYLLSLPLIFAPIAIIQFFIILLWPVIYAVKWATGIPQARIQPAPAPLPLTWAELQESYRLKRFQQQPGFRLLLGIGRKRLIDAQLGETLHHLLITGATGAGKSSVIRTFLCTLLLEGPGLFDRLQIFILDNKGGLGRPFLPIINAYDAMSVFHDEDGILGALAYLQGQITVRQALMDDALAEQPEDAGLGRILVIIDDLQDIIANKDIEAAIASVASKGRSAGVHLVMSMPYSKASLLKTTISVNFGRISGFIRDKAATKSIGIDGLNQLGGHQFGFDDTQRLKPVLFQPLHIRPDDVRALSTQFIASAFSPDEILVELFIQKGGLGRRELAKRGKARAKVIYGEDALPFPFNEIEIDSETSQVRYSKAAREYIVSLISSLAKIGLATPPPTMGESYCPTTRDVTKAISEWRKNKQEVT